MTTLKSYQNNLLALSQMLLHQDLLLFSRKVLDIIADSDDMALFQKGIAYIAAFNANEKNITQQQILSEEIYEAIQHINIPAAKIDLEPTLEVNAITKSYGTGKFKLGPVSLTLKKGQVYGLVGENGNGKTTLLRILAKELAQDFGTIMYNLQDASADSYDLRTKLIYMPQRTAKWYGSLMDNLKFVLANYNCPSEEIELRVLLMVARLGLWKYKDLQWSELSSGYKMRFELARTLLRKPEILFLDEPLANLDILSQQIILEDLKSICTSEKYPIALILSSQQLYEVEKVSDKVIFLKNGQYKETNQDHEQSTSQPLVIELDTTASRDQLAKIFAPLQLTQIQNNGGNFIIEFSESTSFNNVLLAIAQSEITVLYIRNISSSTRRYFLA